MAVPEIYKGNILRLAITTSNGVEIFIFDNSEITEKIQYKGEDYTEVLKTLGSASFSFARKDVPEIRFKVRPYKSAETRQKLFRIVELISGNYQASITLSNFTSAFDSYPFVYDDTKSELNDNLSLSINPVVIEFPNQSIDQVKRGLGAITAIDLELVVYKTAILQFPVDPCSLVSSSDFQTVQIQLNPDNTFNQFTLALEENGLIEQILSYPPGILENPIGTELDRIQATPSGLYGPVDQGSVLSGAVRIIINNIPIILKTGESCSFNLQIDTGVESLGDFRDGDFRSGDFRTTLIV